MKKLAWIALVIAVVVGIGLSLYAESERSRSGPTIVATFEDVHWYPPCATEPVLIGGTLYYPLPMMDVTGNAPGPFNDSTYPLASGVGTRGRLGALGRVVAPGPGDDVGTVIVYSDGMARFESDSGNVDWLTSEKQTYGYIC